MAQTLRAGQWKHARWFQVLMGEKYRLDESSTDAYERRVPLPEQAARDLAFKLEVYDG